MKPFQFQAQLLDSMAQAVIALDLAGKILYWNRYAETLLGWSAVEVQGQRLEAVISVDMGADQRAEIKDSLERGERWFGECTVRRKDVTWLTVMALGAPLYDAVGKRIGQVWAASDVSDRNSLKTDHRQAEIELQEAYVDLEIQHNELEVIHEELKAALEELQATELQLINKAEALTQARQKAEHEQQRYQDLFNFAPDGYLITDMVGNIQNANQAALALLCPGQPPDYLIGLPLRLFVSPAQLSFFSTCLSQVRQPGQVQSFELNLKPSQQANFFPAAIKISGVSSLSHQSQTLLLPSPAPFFGKLVGIRWLIRDITELKQAEAALQKLNAELELRVEARSAELQRTEQRWRTLLETVHLLVVGLDLEGRITYANPFFLDLTGYGAAELIGTDWFERFVIPEERSQVQQAFQQLLTQVNPPLVHQHAILTRSGQRRMITWNNTILHDRDGRITGSMGIGEDITERFKLEQMKDEFISVVSHEIRTPLTAIHGGLSLLVKGMISSQSERGQYLLRVAAENAQRLVRLVNDILDLKRLESGRSSLKKQLLNTRDLTRTIAEAFELTLKEAGIRLVVEDEGIDLVVDGDRIKQVLSNLLDNAIKFSPTNATIRLTVSSAATEALTRPQALDEQAPESNLQRSACFAIQDEGPGIPPEQLDGIFERFVQLDSSNSRAKGGTGLGLSICRNIVKQHGGNIWVESDLGQGSRFYFTVPLSHISHISSLD